MLRRQMRIRKIDETLTQLAVVSNPQKDPKDAQEFVDELIKRRRFMSGQEERPVVLDVEAFEAFRNFTQKESRGIKSK